MARDLRDNCWAERCFYANVFRNYAPAFGNLIIWPHPSCAQNYCTSRPRGHRPSGSTRGGPPVLNCEGCTSPGLRSEVEFLVKLKNYYGFSILHTGIDQFSLEAAYCAGWKKEQLMINPFGSKGLSPLLYADIFYNRKISNDHTLPPDYKNSPHTFHSVFYDEPWKYDNDATILRTYGWPPHLSAPNLPPGVDDNLLHNMCVVPDYNEYENTYAIDRLWDNYENRLGLMSLFIHNCLRTQFIIGVYDTVTINYWQAILDKVNNNPYPVGDPRFVNWVDSGMYQGYDDIPAEWGEIARAGFSGGRVWINAEDWQMGGAKQLLPVNGFEFLLGAARTLGMYQVGFFPGGTNSWSCDIYNYLLTQFCEAAVRTGYLRKIYEQKYICERYRIPGCVEDGVHISTSIMGNRRFIFENP